MTSNVSSDSVAPTESAPSPEQRGQILEEGLQRDERDEQRAAEVNERQSADGFEDIDSDGEQQKSSGQKRARLPIVNIGEGAQRGIRHLFGMRAKPSERSPSAIEEGRAATKPSLLSTPEPQGTRSQPKPISLTSGAEPVSPRGEDRGLSLTRTLSVPRSTSIRFAADSSLSSDLAPGMSNYGANNPGFRRNPALAMNRTTSVQSTGSQKETSSVSFREPEKRR